MYDSKEEKEVNGLACSGDSEVSLQEKTINNWFAFDLICIDQDWNIGIASVIDIENNLKHIQKIKFNCINFVLTFPSFSSLSWLFQLLISTSFSNQCEMPVSNHSQVWFDSEHLSSCSTVKQQEYFLKMSLLFPAVQSFLRLVGFSTITWFFSLFVAPSLPPPLSHKVPTGSQASSSSSEAVSKAILPLECNKGGPLLDSFVYLNIMRD